MPTRDLKEIAADLRRLEKERQVAEGINKIVTTDIIVGIGAQFKIVEMTYEHAIKAGLSMATAEAMAYDIFKQTMTGGVR